jgi:hypothetical protein
MYCPGALADELYHGGQPHILEPGTRRVTVTEVVPEVRSSWNMTFGLTVEQSTDDFNVMAVRLELAALYDVPLSYITLSASPGSLVLIVTIGPPQDESGSTEGATPGAATQSLSAIRERVAATDDNALSSALSATASRTTNMTTRVANVTVLRSVQVDRQQDCMPGYACGTGVLVACRPGAFAQGNHTSECTQCDAGSYQNEHAATACSSCLAGSFCPSGATAELAPSCVEGTYADALDESGDPACFACPPGHACLGSKFPPMTCSDGTFAENGSAVCTDCTLAHSTTLAGARNASADCCCDAGYYLAASGAARECIACDDDETDCSEPGLTLRTLPLREGWWRVLETSTILRKCPIAEACAGGAFCDASSADCDPDNLCAPHHTGVHNRTRTTPVAELLSRVL